MEWASDAGRSRRLVSGDVGEQRCARRTVPGIARVRALELIDEK